ncbi:Serine carboxypeptidase-like 18 [Sesamum angolense]|uniref:Serine carboxypeptidase-like 18 n=1 Tax=Sesamum angolense TaxID=2727404 RepID=A0AAE1WG35_9LAMI|nr:Serine carboxypeptidase-like 18 [Sesamum angolense]
MHCYSSFHLLLCLLLLIINTYTATASSQSIINTLPGFHGIMPFKLETGYIGVGEEDEVQLFYYFIQSENDPERDPLILWLTGGPGCSGFSGLVYEIGPLAFDLEGFDGSFPSLIINPYSWTKVANIIFIDSPVGTGFSYATTPQAYHSNNTISAQYNYSFLRKWLLNHPKFIKNRLYIAGDSHGGKITPMVALEIAKGNEAGLKPRMSLQGYIVGNAVMDPNIDINEKVPYAHRMGLISDEYFEYLNVKYHTRITGTLTISASKAQLQWEYLNPDPNNKECLYALRLVKECTDHIFASHILEPSCNFMSPRPNISRPGELLLEDPIDLILLPKHERTFCRNYNYLTSYVWANNETVREALHIRGTITDWKRCNFSLPYEEDVESVFKHHQLLSEKGFQALVYSGDHDMTVSYTSTLKWIRNMNLTVEEEWRPWFVNGQVAGSDFNSRSKTTIYLSIMQNDLTNDYNPFIVCRYKLKYSKNLAYLTFATVKARNSLITSRSM